ncbi:hypothetical protein PsorP6_010888 [Peronosclerospora sorghi]|uniref:Uncharacterized protein n=1 Tax=Peronosclerospora sorghi TaxID=230839 RepID=A0ACC0VUV0_9STRA|nr:hypothetical protein PsorP6_010888 [Peronosclerospora sorghi]
MDLNQLEQKYMQWTPAQEAIVRAQIGTIVSVNSSPLEAFVDWKSTSMPPIEKFFTTPECAVLAATAYNQPVVIMDDKGQATTYLPYTTDNDDGR